MRPSNALLSQCWNVLSEALLRFAWTGSVSEAFERLNTPHQKKSELVEGFDIAIAAHALALCLVSNNTRHMARVRGLRFENWAAA